MQSPPGSLYVVSTPIGNLGDLSPRATEALTICNWIACEDIRLTGKLLKRLKSRVPALSYREDNEAYLAPKLVKKLLAGENGALICDAGTPTMSDPGFRLIRDCRRASNITVIPIPGPMAAIAALSTSGLPTNGFLFAGFLQAKKSSRIRFLDKYRDFEYSIVLYESCHRITKCLNDLLDTLGPDRTICLAREITKRHETFHVGTAAQVSKTLKTSSTKGEFVVIIAPDSFTL